MHLQVGLQRRMQRLQMVLGQALGLAMVGRYTDAFAAKLLEVAKLLEFAGLDVKLKPRACVRSRVPSPRPPHLPRPLSGAQGVQL